MTLGRSIYYLSYYYVREVTTKGVGWASGEVSDLVAPPLNLVLYMHLRIFAYTSNALIANLSFECMELIRKKLYWEPRSLIVDTRKSFLTTESLKFSEIQGNMFPCYIILFKFPCYRKTNFPVTWNVFPCKHH